MQDCLLNVAPVQTTRVRRRPAFVVVWWGGSWEAVCVDAVKHHQHHDEMTQQRVVSDAGDSKGVIEHDKGEAECLM
jgi:hypothetical protein